MILYNSKTKKLLSKIFKKHISTGYICLSEYIYFVLGSTRDLDTKEQARSAEVESIELNSDEQNVQRMNNDKSNVWQSKIFEEEDGKPYRNQRNVNNPPTKGVEVAKNVLYWLKSLIVT